MPEIMTVASATENTERWFTEFYETYREIILYLIDRQCRNTTDQEDIMQEVLLKLISHTDALYQVTQESPGKVTAFLASTVNSVCVDTYRRSKSEEAVSLTDTDLIEQLVEQQIQSSYEQFDHRQCIELLKGSLLKRDWLLLKGKYFDGLSHRELAAKTGYSYGSVRMALSRAKRLARAILQDQEV